MIREKTCFTEGQGLFQGSWKNHTGTKECLKKGYLEGQEQDMRVQ